MHTFLPGQFPATYRAKTTIYPKRLDEKRPSGYTEDTNIPGKEALSMDVELKVEPGRQEPKIIILAGEETDALRQLAEQLSSLALGPIPVWQGERTRLLPQSTFLRFYADGKGVSAQTDDGETWSVRLRLYELEEKLDPLQFVRISNSEIVNLKRVTALDLSLAGTIRMTLDGTVHTYVSRRYVKKIKEILELGRGRGNGTK